MLVDFCWLYVITSLIKKMEAETSNFKFFPKFQLEANASNLILNPGVTASYFLFYKIKSVILSEEKGLNIGRNHVALWRFYLTNLRSIIW